MAVVLLAVAGTHRVAVVLPWGGQDPWGALHPAVGWPWSSCEVAKTHGVPFILLWGG